MNRFLSSFRRFKQFLEERRVAKRARLPRALVRAANTSRLFDERFYLKLYPDVANSGLGPLEHYLTIGLAEKRRPSAAFDPASYLEANPAVAAGTVDPFIHYLSIGRATNAPLSKAETIDLRPSLTRQITRGSDRLIIFLMPGFNLRAGGVLSIAAIYEETLALADVHGAAVAVCAVPGDDPLFLKYDWFEDGVYFLDLHALLRGFPDIQWLQLQVPEYAIGRVSDWLDKVSGSLLRTAREVHINIMLQNIDLLQVKDVGPLRRFGKVTATTAHEAYSNANIREAIGVPVHWLSVRLGPELYKLTPYHEKQPILVVSHDPHPLKEQILKAIADAQPGLRIQIVEDLSYEEYKALISRAKWSLTFGEGLDGYFVETVFSGGVAFAVFNNRFFTPAFAELETVYPSWEALRENIAADITRLNEQASFDHAQRRAHGLLADVYSVAQSRRNLGAFYRGEYSFP